MQTITGKMNLSEEVDLEDYVARPEKISSADIAAICQEAGMQAVRHNRYVILPKDFETGWKEHTGKKDKDLTSTLHSWMGHWQVETKSPRIPVCAGPC